MQVHFRANQAVTAACFITMNHRLITLEPNGISEAVNQKFLTQIKRPGKYCRHTASKHFHWQTTAISGSCSHELHICGQNAVVYDSIVQKSFFSVLQPADKCATALAAAANRIPAAQI